MFTLLLICIVIGFSLSPKSTCCVTLDKLLHLSGSLSALGWQTHLLVVSMFAFVSEHTLPSHSQWQSEDWMLLCTE